MQITSRSYILFAAGALVLLGALWFAVVHVFAHYQASRYRKGLAMTTQMMQREQSDDVTVALSDTTGGGTPQKTLSLYVDALAAGDYVGASKYFVADKRSTVLATLQHASTSTAALLAEQSRNASKSAGEFSADMQTYVVHDPIFFHLIRYPNGIWKIVEW